MSPQEMAQVAQQMLAHIDEQSRHISEQRKRIDSQAQAIKWRDAKIQSITFQLARLKAWKFGAKTEAMNAEQRSLFEETLAADRASLEAQLAALQADGQAATAPGRGAAEQEPRRQPKREALPPHLPRVEQRIEPEDTRYPAEGCGQPMARVGEDISERLDIVPAQFFVQRQIRGKWAFKPEQRLQMRQQRSVPLCKELHVWLQLERQRVPDGNATANAIDYSLNHWTALTRFLLDGDVPIDNNHIENQMRPWGTARS